MANTDKIDIDVDLVHRLITTQFPQWSDLAIKPVKSSGWDNRTFHLGDQMTVRLPSAAAYSPQVEKEHRWLPKLASHLPLQIPMPLAMGNPGEGYPWHWSIYKWLEGDTASIDRVADVNHFATSLGEFLVALQRIDVTNGPMAGAHNFYRGGPLSIYDAETRQAIANLNSDDDMDPADATSIWEKALASDWKDPPVWVHGDVAVDNLLVKNGQLSAVLDFGCMGVGDPACDLAIAWTFFKDESRDAFRSVLSLDNDTWARGRGWVLWKTLCAPIPGTNCSDIFNQLVSDYKNK